MSKPRTIAVITTSRADYGHLYWPLKDLEDQPGVDLKILALGAHLSSEFGTTVAEIEDDGFSVAEKIECLLSSDTDVGMAKTIGVATLGLSEVLGKMRPDLILLIADRYEMLAPASVALALRIPMAHIEGGEVSEGAIDDAVRNALTKMSHLHFTPTETSRQRVLAMGEESWRVHRVGAPSLDHLRRREMLSRSEVEARLGLGLESPPVLVATHPVTLLRDTLAEADALFQALSRIREPIVFCFPNADAGSRTLVERAEAFCIAHKSARLFVNLDPLTYWSLLKFAGVMVGNSSSGIMETPSLALPTVNIGVRQQGRERARNIIDAPPRVDSILLGIQRARSQSFRESLRDMINPYGDGRASERIVRILSTTPLDEKLLLKRAVSPSPADPSLSSPRA